MNDARRQERQPVEIDVCRGVNGDDEWSQYMELCQQAAELKATLSYRQIAEKQNISVAGAFKRVRAWHTWVARSANLDDLRGQLANRYEWATRQLIAQYHQVLEEAKIRPAQHRGVPAKHEN